MYIEQNLHGMLALEALKMVLVKRVYASLIGIHLIGIESWNPTVQKEAIRPIESAQTTIPPTPYPHNRMHLH